MPLHRKMGFYEKYIKRFLDIVCSLLAIIVFSWLYIIIAIVVRIKMGSPVLFKQPRPGLIDKETGKERIFDIYKFRTMTNECDEKGEPLSDEKRLHKFGKILRATSLDELPEAINILKGDMSVIGPRPQLVKDMVFMTAQQRMRHTAKPGLSGLAQVMGRNAVSWEEKINWDLKYIENVSFIGDFRIIGRTVMNVFGNKESIQELDITDDFGDALLKAGSLSQDKYDMLQFYAKKLIDEHNKGLD